MPAAVRAGTNLTTVSGMANPSITIGAPNRGFDSTTRDSLVNLYGARYATIADADAIDQVVKEAFGASAPNSSAARDIKRANTTYIVATKNRRADGSPFHSERRNAGWTRKLRSIFSSSIGKSESEQAASEIVGLVGIWTAVDQAHIVVIATRPSERGKGVGELLLIATLSEAKKIGATNATLEVRKSNLVARALYRKYGFADVGIRHKYYHDNREDAIIMSTPSFSNLDYSRSLDRRCLAYTASRGKIEFKAI